MGVDAPGFAAIDSQLESIHGSLKKIYKTDAFGSVCMTDPSSPITDLTDSAKIVN